MPYDMTDANSMAASSDLSASSTSAQLQDQDLISSGQFAIVRKVGGEHLRLCRITNGQRILIEKLSFDPVNAIGKPYGMFEVSNGGKVLTPFSPCPPTLDANETAEPDSTQNRDQKDSNLLTQNGDGKEEQQDNVHRPRQKMTEEAIDALKSEGISTSDLVSRLVQGNFSFQDRTPFSKQKYVRKKTRKHSDRILISKPSIRLLCQTYYSKDPERLCHLRLDQLGLLLQFSAVHSGGCNVLVFEQTLGLTGAAILERLGGRGSLIFLHKGDWPQSIPCLDAMDFGEEQKQTFLPLRITTLLQPQLAEEEQKDGQSAAGEVEGKEEPPQKKAKTTEDSSVKFHQKKLQRSHKERTALALIQPGEGRAEGRLDAICIACRTVCPVEILERTFAGLRLSGSVVVYSPFKHHLLRAFQWLRSQGCVNIQLSQQSCRAHQVLPNRTHPLMQQPVTGGYILHATKVMMPLPSQSQHSQQQQQRMETDKMEMETS